LVFSFDEGVAAVVLEADLAVVVGDGVGAEAVIEANGSA
jgi:hypothetical protein